MTVEEMEDRINYLEARITGYRIGIQGDAKIIEDLKAENERLRHSPSNALEAAFDRAAKWYLDSMDFDSFTLRGLENAIMGKDYDR